LAASCWLKEEKSDRDFRLRMETFGFECVVADIMKGQRICQIAFLKAMDPLLCVGFILLGI
jgi:hypothetical protein